MRIISTLLAVAVCVLTVSCAAQDRAADAWRAKSPEDLLKTVRTRYLAAKSYRDQGIVKSDFKSSNPHFNDKPFSTAFERGGRFCFSSWTAVVAGREPRDRYVVWSKDQVTFESWWDLRREHSTQDDFDTAMAGPSGVSGGSAAAIIPLLRGVRPPTYWPLAALEDRGMENVDGVECRVIAGKSFSSDSVAMWIDGRGGIRRIFTSVEIDPSKLPPPPSTLQAPVPMNKEKFIVETTIEITPVFDKAIPDEAFEFEVPTTQ